MVTVNATTFDTAPVHGTVGAMLRFAVREVAEKAGIRNALDLSQRAGLPYESCRRLWQGTSSMVALTTLERLCQVLEVRPAQLFDYEPEPLPPFGEIKQEAKRAKKKARKS
jgi:DNA-binding Xre family transcriptional regulator